MKRFLLSFLVLCSFTFAVRSQAQELTTVKLGYAKCAHCTPITLTPSYVKGVQIELVSFNTGNDLLTALVSKAVDVAATATYLHYAAALDKSFDVIAISGQVNGGSQMLIGNDIAVKEHDWAGLKKVIAEYKTAGKPFRVAASRGNAQDIHMRGAFAKQGIDVNRDLQFINIPNPSDHVQALRRGEVEIITSVEPFASQIRMLKAAKLFTFPYDQAAGRLTNLVLTRPDVIAASPKALEAVVRAIIQVNDLVASNKPLFIDTISKVTGLERSIAAESVENLYPDYRMHRKQAQSIALMMRDLKYISNDVTAAVEKNMDYRFLEAVTGKKKSELGFE